MKQRPTCAVRGLLHGGRAVCGAVIVSDKSCGFDGQCEHQRQPAQLVECDHCPTSGGCVGGCMKAQQPTEGEGGVK